MRFTSQAIQAVRNDQEELSSQLLLETGIEVFSCSPDVATKQFAHLASLCTEHERAWDCATGNGQAVVGLAPHFTEVTATDISAEQLLRAIHRKNITYTVGPAEECHLPDSSVDLITGGHAVHWVDTDSFYSEVRRVAKPDCVLALFGFRDAVVSPEIDTITAYYIHELLGSFWIAEVKDLDDSQFRNLKFPFEEISLPQFTIRVTWNSEQLLALYSSYSGAQRFQDYHGQNPTELIREQVIAAWGGQGTLREIRIPIYMRAGIIHRPSNTVA